MIQDKEKAHEIHHVRIEEYLQRQEHEDRVEALLERASQKAITTGNRQDLHELLKLRRRFL